MDIYRIEIEMVFLGDILTRHGVTRLEYIKSSSIKTQIRENVYMDVYD